MVIENNIDLIHDMILNDRRITAKFIAEICSFSVGSVKKMVHDEFRFKKSV